MSKHAFYELCNALRRNNLLSSSKNMSIQEQVLIFLEIVGFNERFRKIGSHFYRSIESIHRCFHTVLQAVLKLYPILIKPPDGSIKSEIRNNYRYYRWFANCVGVIDGTHVLAPVPIEQQSRFRGRKGTPTQNVLAAINFNLKFTYVLAGWEGSAHDSRILNDALERPHGFQIPQDKFYLGDAGFGLRKGFIPPYHGVCYHLQEYSDRPPQNEKELFNLRHASLRSTVERAFAILKRLFRVIYNEPFWDFKTQVDVVLASCILHNHIINLDPNDMIIQEVDVEPLVQPQNVQITQSSQGSQSYQTQRQRREVAREWSSKRDAIAHAMFTNYYRRRN
uniref:Uncharacterized protein n=1 Tax=Solanum lycopersicum TaxID=4081 RepID=A0A3Q7J852_SOLLC